MIPLWELSRKLSWFCEKHPDFGEMLVTEIATFKGRRSGVSADTGVTMSRRGPPANSCAAAVEGLK
jgi:hypothetical protein